MQYNFYCSLNRFVDWEKFMGKLIVNCVQSHVMLIHYRDLRTGINILYGLLEAGRMFFFYNLAGY